MHPMKTTKGISGAAYCGLQADLAAREGAVSAKLAHLFFQCATMTGERALEEWDALVNAAREAGATIEEALEFGEE